ncbi:MAG: TetR/AcrR family transcriptional regulator [Pseudomonadota bacterium]
MPATATETNDETNPSTRDRILDTAELLIIEHGYAGTSLRAIANQADVNLAATHYHFGSKQGLIAAVIHRRMAPISAARLTALDSLEAGPQPLTIRAVVKAFLTPLYFDERNELLAVLPSLIGRVYGEPESLTKPLLEQEFTQVAARYINVLSTLLPDVPTEEVRWRFHFSIGAMIQLLRFHSPLGVASSHDQFIQGLDYLVNYTVAGLLQTNSGTAV